MISFTASTAIAQDGDADLIESELFSETPKIEQILSESNPLPPIDRQRLDLVSLYRNQDAQPILEGNALTYRYGFGQPSLVCAPLHVCALKLAPGERISANGLLIGDVTRWKVVQIRVDGDDSLIIGLKPVDAGLKTSLSILTDDRHYHVELLSHPNEYMPMVAFRYDDLEQRAINELIAETLKPTFEAQLPSNIRPEEYRKVALSDLNFDYTVSRCQGRRQPIFRIRAGTGPCRWRPERVYDDGVRTMIVLPKESEREALPSVFVVTAQSDSQLANARFRDGSFIVDRLFDEARLVLGAGRDLQEVRIRRNGK